MNLSLDTISIQLPESCHSMNITYIDESFSLQSLDLDSSLLPNYFSNIDLNSLFPFATLSALPDPTESSEGFMKIFNHLYSSNTIITASSLDHLDHVFFLCPCILTPIIFLKSLSIIQLISLDPQNLNKYIQSLTSTNRNLGSLCKSIITEKNLVEDHLKVVKKRYRISKNECDALATEFVSCKKLVRKLAKEFDEIEKDFKPFECCYCRTNIKNVIFLPCGHLILCNDCLYRSFNITPNLPISNSKFRCLKCRKIVEQSLVGINLKES